MPVCIKLWYPYFYRRLPVRLFVACPESKSTLPYRGYDFRKSFFYLPVTRKCGILQVRYDLLRAKLIQSYTGIVNKMVWRKD